MVGFLSNIDESQHLCLPPQAPISVEIHHPRLPYFTVGTSQDIHNHKSIEDEEEWEVSQIMESKLKRGKVWYLVKLKGFSQDPERSTWHKAKNSIII
ncbi:hypothetical protein O181_019034 [Austropuccinia psidii MF-1]|uniref:Chromo domain-containing protein n=1 Tax=Austropuccinia psidii MF-1 TaxID=1389203 RepID=A0A9Q3GUB9_9BASI|nr:hypothetical protein [Austropuccinia psidii MF-1]